MKAIVYLLGVALTVTTATALEEEATYPMLSIANDDVSMTLYLPGPDAFYRGPRFDGSGIINQVHYAGHVFYGPWRTPHDPEGNDGVSGPAEEFGMVNPSGFSEVGAGGSFVKVGVGLLRKSNDPVYHFLDPYEIIRAGEWEVRSGDDWVEFGQDFTGERGWAYRYRKRIELSGDRPGFSISHRLENRGEKTIDINHYNHNFTRIDEVPYGPDYTITLPFSADEPVDMQGMARFTGNRIVVDKPLGGKSLELKVQPEAGPAAYNAATIRCDKTGAAVRFKGDQPIVKYNFWAVATAACPEPFIRILLEPGDVKEWTTEYTLMADDVFGP